jgi:hypothetical protein
MSSSEFRQRVADHPASLPGAVGGIAVTIGLLIVLRVGAGIVLSDPVHPVTYLSVAGGGFGAVGMFLLNKRVESGQRFPPVDFWANRIGDGEVAEYQRQGLYLHVTYGAAVAGTYPRIVQELMGGGAGGLFAALPLSLVTGLVFGLVLFALGVVYARVGFFELDLQSETILPFVSTHVVYGLVLGLVVGLWLPVLQPAF